MQTVLSKVGAVLPYPQQSQSFIADSNRSTSSPSYQLASSAYEKGLLDEHGQAIHSRNQQSVHQAVMGLLSKLGQHAPDTMVLFKQQLPNLLNRLVHRWKHRRSPNCGLSKPIIHFETWAQ